jgi:hypothetical protein
MLQFPGNLQLEVNLLRWLDRGGKAHRVVLLRGDVPMYGAPRPVVDDGTAAGKIGKALGDFNSWLEERNDWLLTLDAMRVIAIGLAAVLALAALAAMPMWRRQAMDGRWLRPDRQARGGQDRMVARADSGSDDYLLAATILRDNATAALAALIERPDPLFALGEGELVTQVSARRGQAAGAALHKVYRRLRALPSRTQAAAPWGAASLSRREFERLHDDVNDLYRALGAG